MDKIFIRILNEWNKDPLRTTETFEELHALRGLSFNESIVFWGLTPSNSTEENWSRVALNNYTVNNGTETALQKEIHSRIINSGHRNRKFDIGVYFYMQKILYTEKEIPSAFLPTLRKKFEVIY